MSTEDLLRYFIEPTVTEQDWAPQWVEWVNDSSANVVFGSDMAAAAAAERFTVPLLPNAQGVDTQAWRTMPEASAAAGKGLQLLFRIATYEDVKPAKRAASRWYGEEGQGGRRRSGGKTGGVHERRGQRQSASAPYGRGPTKAERDAARDRAIAAAEREAGKKSLAEAITMKGAMAEQLPSLADTIQMRQGPTLADMAGEANGGSLTLAPG